MRPGRWRRGTTASTPVRVERGATRVVVLAGRWAFKFPTPVYGWRNFLYGLLANMQERMFATTGWPELCPVLFSLPGGWIVVMPRCESLRVDGAWVDPVPHWWGDEGPDEAWWAAFTQRAEYEVPVEHKADSLGLLNGRIVAVDYGGWANEGQIVAIWNSRKEKWER